MLVRPFGRERHTIGRFPARTGPSRTTSYTIKFRDGKIVRWSSPLPGAPVAAPQKQ